MEFVWSQVDEDLSLKKMAEVSGLSVTHFSYMFRRLERAHTDLYCDNE
jgi:hypothetical protein